MNVAFRQMDAWTNKGHQWSNKTVEAQLLSLFVFQFWTIYNKITEACDFNRTFKINNSKIMKENMKLDIEKQKKKIQFSRALDTMNMLISKTFWRFMSKRMLLLLQKNTETA